MKKTDIAMIIFIATLGVMIAYFIATNIPFLTVKQEGVEVKTIQAIYASVADPDREIFAVDAINPTVEIVIGGTGGADTVEVVN